MKMFVLLLIITTFAAMQSVAQDQHIIDSLQTALKKVKQDTSKVKILYQLSKAYYGNDPEMAMDYARQALAIAEKIGFKRGMCNTYNIMGNIVSNKGDYKQALEFQNKALKIRKEIGDKEGIAASYNNIGTIHDNIGNYTEALKNYLAALKINEEIQNKNFLGSNYSNIGIIYAKQGNYPEALKNCFNALKIRVEIGDKEGISNSYGNIGIIYRLQGNYPAALKNYYAALEIAEEIGDKRAIAINYSNIGGIYDITGNYPEALKSYATALKIFKETGNKDGIASSYGSIAATYYNQGNNSEALKNYFTALKIDEEIGDKQGIANIYGNIGVIYALQGKYPEALKNYLASLKIDEEIGDKQGIAFSYNSIGKIYTQQKKYNDATHYLNKSLSLSKEMGSLDNIKANYYNLAELDSAQGNFKQALENYKLFITYRDSIYNEENTKKLVQSQMQYEFDKKEALTKAEQEKKDAIAQKEMQKQKLVRNGFVGGFAIVLLFAVVFFTQRNKIKNGKKRSDDLLLNILPTEVAEELKAKGSAEAQLIDEVTVLFTDFKGFTAYSEKLSPKELVRDIHECFSAFDLIMEKHGMEKIKTIGDSYMAAGGLPTPNHTHATDAVKAALEIRQFIQEGKTRKIVMGAPYFEIRIGIHTGPVVAGIVGLKKFAYDIWGDTVNTASRMESSGEAGKVNISGSTYELVKDKFSCTHRGKVEAKHKGMIDMYFVEAV